MGVRAGRLIALATVAVTALAPAVAAHASAPRAVPVGDDPVLTVIAGGPGTGPALGIGQTPTALATADDGSVLVADEQHAVVRRLDVSTGDESVEVGNGDGAREDLTGDTWPTPSTDVTAVQADGHGGLYVGSGGGISYHAPEGWWTTLFGPARFANPDGTTTVEGARIDGTTTTATALVWTQGGPAPRLGTDLPGEVRAGALANGSAVHAYAELTLAGGGAAIPAEGAKALDVHLVAPGGIVTSQLPDTRGDLVFTDAGDADHASFVLRRDSDGVLHVLAGGGNHPDHGSCSSTWDGRAATNACFDGANAVAEDIVTGATFVTDVHGLARIDADGTIHDASAGLPDADGAVPATRGIAESGYTIYVASPAAKQVFALADHGTAPAVAVAGDGTTGAAGDGGPAADAEMTDPGPVVVEPDGAIDTLEAGALRIRRLAPDGTMTTVVGDGRPGFGLDGLLGPRIHLNDPVGLAALTNGDVDFGVADPLLPGVTDIQALHPDGLVTTRVSLPPCVDLAALCELRSLLALPDGSVLLGERGRIEQLTPLGAVLPWATLPDTADDPAGLAALGDGAVAYADPTHRTVMRVVRGAAPTTVIGPDDDIGREIYYNGVGTPGFTPATYWRSFQVGHLVRPEAVLAAPDGSLLIADSGMPAVVQVLPDLRTRLLTDQTAASPGSEADSGGSGGAAAWAAMDGPRGMALTADGTLVVSDSQASTTDPAAPGAGNHHLVSFRLPAHAPPLVRITGPDVAAIGDVDPFVITARASGAGPLTTGSWYFNVGWCGCGGRGGHVDGDIASAQLDTTDPTDVVGISVCASGWCTSEVWHPYATDDTPPDITPAPDPPVATTSAARPQVHLSARRVHGGWRLQARSTARSVDLMRWTTGGWRRATTMRIDAKGSAHLVVRRAGQYVAAVRGARHRVVVRSNTVRLRG
ncbi:MAG TPA: hypothetical protein VHE83_11480 [Mycobacteriales bacterium]|nr:hypothetical protein [Mycobacteriales bacterium]